MNVKVRASASHYWSPCPGWVTLVDDTATMKDVSGDPAREGTCAAWVAECVMKGLYSTCVDMLGMAHENGWVVDEEMVGHIQAYCDETVGWTAEHPISFEAHGVTVTGTSDAVRNETDVLRIRDLKYGWRIIEPLDNPQLLDYAWGVIEQTGYIPPKIEVSIYQPRPNHRDGALRTHTYTAFELQQTIDRVIMEPLKRIGSGDDTCIAGKHCIDCRVANRCETLTNAVYSITEALQGRGSLDLTGQQLAGELDLIEIAEHLIKARGDALRADAEYRIGQNKFVPGWCTKNKYGNSKFIFDRSIIKVLTGVDPVQNKPMTPAEMKRRKVNKDIVDSLATKPFIGRKLQRVTDTQIAAMFNKPEGS